MAECLIDAGTRDNANEIGNYANVDYVPVNPPLDPTLPGNPGIVDPNRWQPLSLATFVDQSGNVTGTPSCLGADWGQLVPFALDEDDRTERVIDWVTVPVWRDPGPPPRLTDDPENNRVYEGGNALVVQRSAMLDPTDGVVLDISPGAIGDLGPLEALPTDPAGILAAYDARSGGFGGAFAPAGHPVNPATGEPYAPNLVPRGDYTRVLAEFWADGPDSETPPGHWFSVYNQAVVGHPAHATRLEGAGEPIDPLEYDLHAYLALGGAMHDSAIAAWSVKRAYDYVRPVSAIRYLASLGQSSDAAAANYHVDGIPLVEGLIESVLAGDPLAGETGSNVGRIKARAWRGPDAVVDPDTDVAGVGWILLETWWPYQRPTFVTPPFAGYVSGHSTFSRAAAEVLTALTGDAFFPDGLGEFVAPANEFLVFERGPSEQVVLQWATYRTRPTRRRCRESGAGSTRRRTIWWAGGWGRWRAGRRGRGPGRCSTGGTRTGPATRSAADPTAPAARMADPAPARAAAARSPRPARTRGFPGWQSSRRSAFRSGGGSRHGGDARDGRTPTAVSWYTAPPSGRPGSALTRVLMPSPPAKAAFGHRLSTTTVPGSSPSDARTGSVTSPSALNSVAGSPSTRSKRATSSGCTRTLGPPPSVRRADAVSVKLEFRNCRAGAATSRSGCSSVAAIDDVPVIGQLRACRPACGPIEAQSGAKRKRSRTPVPKGRDAPTSRLPPAASNASRPGSPDATSVASTSSDVAHPRSRRCSSPSLDASAASRS